MYFTTPLLLLSSFALPFLTSAEPVAQALPPQQTIVPFTTLPPCAKQCGKLFDVQGACSPPVVDASNTKTCFCADPRLTPFNTGTTGVCDQAQCDAASLTTIEKWYKGLCGGTNSGTAPTTTSSGAAGSTGTSAGSASANTNGNGTWISTHVKWIIMAVILIIAIIGGWVGAWLLRRRYLQRKEREFELRPPATPWVAGSAGKHSNSPYGDGILDVGASKEARSSVLGSPAGVKKGKNRLSKGVESYGVESYGAETEKPKRKWTVSERT